ncbi:hypothetical protein QQX09_10960 [Demequina sp. SYSU T00192]|uniref:Uncharacterized protein n=1 Tax=Demequina litoralis TaxID=3051660 RepID=A0ABT8GB52_9MICO|nr:hypothetical protein [Demequina sp. SYSU T00192]MDN4476375.1 hypothetical protein [Demequina sp. SYSU T00192]
MPAAWGLTADVEHPGLRDVLTVRDDALVSAGIRCTVNASSLDCVEAVEGEPVFSMIDVEWAADPVPYGTLLDAGQEGWFVIVGATAEPLRVGDGPARPLAEVIAMAGEPGYPPWEPALTQWGPWLGLAALAVAGVGLLARRQRRPHRGQPGDPARESP